MSDSPLQTYSSSINSSIPLDLQCLLLSPGSLIMTAFIISNMLLILPLCCVIIYHGFQQCWRQRSSTAGAMSLSDNVTYHMVAVQLINVFGNICCFYGIYKHDIQMLMVWWGLASLTWYGETLFHVLTCVEPYFAVVHPITYLSLRKERWIKFRNILTGCIWPLCFGWGALDLIENVPMTVDVCFLISCVVMISFCSISVLYVLIRPGPGKEGGGRVRVNQSKQRAFYTIMAVLGALLLRFMWNLAWFVQDTFNERMSPCVRVISDGWISLPSSLVVPLLFLQRAGILVCCKNNTKD